MAKINWKDVLIRAAKTFVQAAVPILIAALNAIDISEGREAAGAVLLSAGLSAAAAGISAAWNILAGVFAKPNVLITEEA